MAEASRMVGAASSNHSPPATNLKYENEANDESTPSIYNSAGGLPATPHSSDKPSDLFLRNKLREAVQNDAPEEIESLLGQGAGINADVGLGKTCLHIASELNHPRAAKALLAHRPDVSIKDSMHSKTPLDIAAWNGFEEIIEALLEHPSIDPNIQDFYHKWSPLHLAILNGHRAAVNALLASKRVDINLVDFRGRTPVHIAAGDGLSDILKDLLEAGATIDVRDGSGNSPLHLAAQARCSAAVEILLSKGENVNSKNQLGETPLHTVCSQYIGRGVIGGNVASVVTALLENGADTSARVGRLGDTPLHLAAQFGLLEGVRTLLRSNNRITRPDRLITHINSTNCENLTPLSIAIRHQHTEIVRLMLGEANPEADLTLKGPLGRLRYPGVTMLEYVFRSGNTEIAKLLLQPTHSTYQEMNSSWHSDVQYTPLTWAVNEGNLEMVEVLLESGAGIDTQDAYSYSPLRLSSSLGHVEVTKLLLRFDPTIDLREEKSDWTALHYASCYGHYQIVQLLLEKRANACARTTQGPEEVLGDRWTPQAPTGGGDTPLSLALYMFHAECINVLLGCLRSMPNNDDPGQERRYLGLENDHDRVMRYSLDRLKWAASHKSIHDLLKFVLKQEIIMESYVTNRFDCMIQRRDMRLFEGITFALRDFGEERLKKERPLWSALEWAVYWRDLELVDIMLVSDNDLGKAREDAKEMAQAFSEVVHQAMTEMKEVSSIPWPERDSTATLDSLGGRDTSEGELRDHDTQVSKDTDTNVPGHYLHIFGGQFTLSGAYREFYEAFRKMEEDYIDIRDALQYGIPVDPSIVSIRDGDRVLPSPTLGQNIRASIGDFFAGIIDVYKGEDGVALLRRSRKVDDVVYDKGPSAIMESARAHINNSQQRSGKPSTKLEEKDLQLRWVHLPANNMRWMEDLSAKLLRVKISSSEEQNLSATDWISQDFLQRSWHQLPMGMKPACLKLFTNPTTGSKASREVEKEEKSNLDPDEDDASKTCPRLKERPEDSAPAALALYMPYFTFSTLTDEEYNPGPTAHQQREEEAGIGDKVSSPSFQQTNSYGSPIFRLIRSIRPRVRATWLGRGESESEQPHLSRTGHTLSTIPQVGTYQKLIEAYKESGAILHVSQTLDEYFHHSFPDQAAQEDLRYRNRTQVTSKRIRDVGLHGNGRVDWTIIRVDHLWIWIIDDKTIISSSTHRMDKVQDPILEGIWKHMNSDKVKSGRRSLPSSSYGMAQFITAFCINFFHSATCKVAGVGATTGEFPPVKESIPEIFKNEINKASRDETRLLDDFTSNIRSVISDLGSTVPQKTADLEFQARQQVKNNFLSIQKASELLKQIKDIRDELNMLKSILTQQKGVWNELRDTQSEEHNLRGPAYAINSVDEMDAQAARVQSAVLSTLDLEQNKASIQEAMTSREQAQESIRQGRTLMAFTVLPGSFLVALFALNIAIFPHSGENVSWPNWVFGVTFGLTVAFLAIVLTTTFYLDAVRQFIKKLNEKTQAKPAPVGVSALAV
ncbi:hypothetical protein O1611_g544 [Lasiodiplodia mahajangana]|uniref:Uncharacterized protein n=1 Tax=Lasiodiplodia mahajangana TaxID=1108764 RepID=A0ACC2JZW9_9PEZI|nr:hypothetical protein O1611_g544 [Lasiodiplodia mahajangana]